MKTAGQIRQWLFASARDEAERHFDAGRLLCLIPRETAWYAITLFESAKAADHALANRIIEKLIATDGTHTPATLFAMLQRYDKLLTPAARRQLVWNLEQNLPISARVRYSDGNVNHPLAAYAHLICAGAWLGHTAYAELGAGLLRDFHTTIASRRHQRRRQAEMAEYNSPTYTALTLWFLALIAEFAPDGDARRLATFLEERLWCNVAMHWHAPSQQFAGPFSRAYAEDSAGGYSALHCTFAYALAPDIFFDANLARRFDHPSALIENAFIAILNFHVPEQARAIALHKPLPYHLRMTTYCEQYHENGQRAPGDPAFDEEVYPGGWGDLTTYLTAEYCLGSASRPYVNAGQADSFSLRYRRADRVRSLADFRGAYTRMVFNGAVVGQANRCHVTGTAIGKDYLYEEGRAFVYQHRQIAMVCYHAKRPGHRAVRELRLDLIFSYHAPFDHLRAGGVEVQQLPHHLPLGETVLIADFRTYLAILPLPATCLAGFSGETRIWQADDHLLISFYNYIGPERDFSREQMSATLNGFACLLASKDDFATIGDFAAAIAAIRVEATVAAPGQQMVRLQRGNDEMVFAVDHLGERILQRTWNGCDETASHYEIAVDPQQPAYFYPPSLYDLPEGDS